MNFAKKSRFSDNEVIFWQTLLVLDHFGCVLSISEPRIALWSILRRIFGPKVKNAIFPCQKWHFWAKFSFICRFLPKYASVCQQNVFWGLPAPKTHPNYPQTKGFALKHHQNDSRQLFWKIKILHFFQIFNFEKSKFPENVENNIDFEWKKKFHPPP